MATETTAAVATATAPIAATIVIAPRPQDACPLSQEHVYVSPSVVWMQVVLTGHKVLFEQYASTLQTAPLQPAGQMQSNVRTPSPTALTHVPPRRHGDDSHGCSEHTLSENVVAGSASYCEALHCESLRHLRSSYRDALLQYPVLRLQLSVGNTVGASVGTKERVSAPLSHFQELGHCPLAQTHRRPAGIRMFVHAMSLEQVTSATVFFRIPAGTVSTTSLHALWPLHTMWTIGDTTVHFASLHAYFP